MNRGALSGVTPRQFDEREYLQTDARYAVNTLPPYVAQGSLAKPTTWDAATQTYNVTPDRFANFRLALAKARAGVTPCNVDFHGDSITAGFQITTPEVNSFPEVVRAMFQTSGEWGSNVYEGGPINGSANGGPTDSRLTFTGLTTGGLGQFGLGGLSGAGSNTGGSLTFGPVTCEVFDVYDKLQGFPAGAGWTWAVDGGAGTFVSQSGAGSGSGNRKTAIPAGAYGPHTLTITLSSGNWGVIDGIAVRNPTRTAGGIYVRRLGVGGISVGTAADLSSSIACPVSREFALTTTTPNLAVVSFGTNAEPGGFNPGTWKANMTAWIAAVQAVGADVLLVTAPPGGAGVTAGSAQARTLAALAPLAYQVADATNCGLLDWYWRWGPDRTSVADQYFQVAGNSGHPNIAGHTDAALAVYRALRRIA